MFRSFFKMFGCRQASFASVFFLANPAVAWLQNEENERINKKLKMKLNDRFHHHRDISYELTE